jgi:hypothetical protein
MVALSTDEEAVQAQARQFLFRFSKLPFYAHMFEEAGLPVTDESGLDALERRSSNGIRSLKKRFPAHSLSMVPSLYASPFSFLTISWVIMHLHLNTKDLLRSGR